MTSLLSIVVTSKRSKNMSHAHPGFRLFVVGAGFSRPAGLPLACELFSEVKKIIEIRYGGDTKFHRDLRNYIDYRKACDSSYFDEKMVDLEELMSYLDIEHYLELRGSDTWSSEGNESQLMIRRAIGEVISSRTPQSDRLPDCYYRFAENISTHDTVLTLNYDLILERAMEHVGKPYRLFSRRYKNIGKYTCTVDSDVEEVVLLKLHGSLDWFDDRQYLKLKQDQIDQGLGDHEVHSVFDHRERYKMARLVDGPRPTDDLLLHIHRANDIDAYYACDRTFSAPLVLSPSHVKFVYAEPLLDFWRGMGQAGGTNLGISIVGFSLPAHDEYIRIGLYQMISNYQQSWWNEKILDTLKDNVRLVDFRNSSEGIADLKMRYSFVDTTRAEYFFEGFGNKAVDFLFARPRMA